MTLDSFAHKNPTCSPMAVGIIPFYFVVEPFFLARFWEGPKMAFLFNTIWIPFLTELILIRNPSAHYQAPLANSWQGIAHQTPRGDHPIE